MQSDNVLHIKNHYYRLIALILEKLWREHDPVQT